MVARFRTWIACALGALTLTTVWCASVCADGAGWVATRSESGIESSRRRAEGVPLDAFRGVTTIESDLWTVLAILEDVDRAAEWTAHCAEMRAVARPSPRELLVYARMDAPWPVRDRDVVTRVRLTSSDLRTVVAEIEAVPEPSEPPRAGVVRMPQMRARYELGVERSGTLRVSYEVSVDPGGTLPDWLKNLIARDLAHDTLARLRSRTAWAHAHGTYRARAQELARLAASELGDRIEARP